MKKNLKNWTKYADCNGKLMEAGDHLKNGASLKNQISRNVSTMSRFIFSGIVLLSFFIVGCEKNDNKNEISTTVEEDKVNIQASFDRTKNLLETLKNGSFYKFADQFIGYEKKYTENYYYYQVGEGNGNYSYNYNTDEYEYTPGAGNYVQNSYNYYDDVISEFTEMLGEKLEEIVDFDKIGNEGRFNFATVAGRYVWDNSSKRWNKTSHNSVLVLFPSSENKGSNDCEAAITAYEDKQCDIEGDIIYLPTKANIYLKQNDEKLFSTDLTADFSEYGIPKQVTVNVYTKPLNFDISLAQESPTKFKAEVSIADETKSKNNLIINCEATLSNGLSKYSDFDDMYLNVLKFNIRQHELSIVGTVDLKTLDQLNNTAENINKCTNFEVFHKTQKTGTLKIVDLDDNKYLYIVYKDGTQENTSIYYDSFIEDIKTMFEEYLE
ncbi:MAG: hypothetical protein LBE04_00985 [Prevotellaceae bacterium]|nr:hypothetical protein [Prevotellaceae bacterium]